MGIKRPPRLRRFDYRGKYRYFLTICTVDRRVFHESDATTSVIAQFLHLAEEYNFAVPAYCVMTNHLHALLRGCEARSDFRQFVVRFKQRTGFDWKQRTGQTLWQEGYFDRVLREEETDLSVIAYIAANPVSAGLAASCAEYPFLGSSEYSARELEELIRQWQGEQAIDRWCHAVEP